MSDEVNDIGKEDYVQKLEHHIIVLDDKQSDCEVQISALKNDNAQLRKELDEIKTTLQNSASNEFHSSNSNANVKMNGSFSTIDNNEKNDTATFRNDCVRRFKESVVDPQRPSKKMRFKLFFTLFKIPRWRFRDAKKDASFINVT